MYRVCACCLRDSSGIGIHGAPHTPWHAPFWHAKMELDLLKRLSHPSIVKYLGHINTAGDEYDTTSSFSGTASPPSPSLYILLEYCEGGSLLTVRQKFGTFSEQLVAVYTAQILEGLVYLHEQGVVHRDVKAGNVLATKEGRVKLADVGGVARRDVVFA